MGIKHAARYGVGKLGENYAAHFLRSMGYDILDTNFRVRGGEVDIVAEAARNAKYLVFVEVKTRTSDLFGRAEDSFTWRKKIHFERAIREYIKRKFLKRYLEEPAFRKDFIDIQLDRTGKVREISHFEDV